MRSKIVTVCLLVIVLFSLNSTINEVFEFTDVFEYMEKFNQTENSFRESLTNMTKMNKNFVDSLEELETITSNLCEVWKMLKHSALSKIPGCQEIDPCIILHDVQSVQKKLQTENSFDSIIEGFGDTLHNESYKFVDSIVVMERKEPEKIPIFLQNINVTIEENDNDFAKTVKSLTNGFIKFEIDFHSCLKNLPIKQARDMFHHTLKGPYFVAKNLVLILSYYLSRERVLV